VKKQLATGKTHFKRVRNSFILASFFVFTSLLAGVLSYHYTASLSWVNSFLNASMILTGMGPVDKMPNNLAKIFSSIYAIFGGIVFLSSIALVLTRLMHRVFHRFEIEDK
jgi:hypothetical protein